MVHWKVVLPITQSKIPLAKWETFLNYACISLNQNSVTGMEKNMSNKRKMMSKESIMDILMVVLLIAAIILLALVLWPQVFPEWNSSIHFKHRSINRRPHSAWKIYVGIINDLFYTRNKSRSTKTSHYYATRKNWERHRKGSPGNSRGLYGIIYHL